MVYDKMIVGYYTFEKISQYPERYIIRNGEDKQVAELQVSRNHLYCDKDKWGGKTIYSVKVSHENFLTQTERHDHFYNITKILNSQI